MKKFFLFLIVVGVVAVYVWPTRYQHYPAGENPHNVQVLATEATRVDRITGDIEAETAPGEWMKVGNSRKALAFQNPSANPNAVHKPERVYDNSTANQQQNAYEKTQKQMEAATGQ